MGVESAGNNVNSWFSEDCNSLSCRLKESSQAALWPLGFAVATGVAVIGLYNFNTWLGSNREWAKDLREHRQDAASRYQRINAFLIIGGIIATAIATIKVVSASVTVAATASVFGGIWLGVGAAVVLNHWIHKQTLHVDGRALPSPS